MIKRYSCIFSIIFSLISIRALSQWKVQYQTASPLYDIRFINKTTGWACGGSEILKTNDGGENWTVYNIPNLFLQIHPVNDTVVYACGYYIIIKTVNGGNNWTTLYSGQVGDEIFRGLWFKDENTGMNSREDSFIHRDELNQ